MRLRISMINQGGPVTFPRDYNYLIQSSIYSAMDRDIANFLHTEGFQWEGKRFKLFTFSRLLGSMEYRNGEFSFHGVLNLVITSPIVDILESIAVGLSRRGTFKIGRNELEIVSFKVDRMYEDLDLKKGELLVKTISPVTLRETIYQDGKKVTIYPKPTDDNYLALLRKNLYYKIGAFKVAIDMGFKPSQLEVKFLESLLNLIPKELANSLPVGFELVGEPKKRVLFYKRFVADGWEYVANLKGNPELLKFIYLVGLGERNAQGYGCLERANRKRVENEVLEE